VKSNPLFGPGGERIGDESKEPSLPEATQAFIKVEINSGLDGLRTANEHQFRQLRTEIRKRWLWLTVLSWALTAVFGVSFYGAWKDIPKRVSKEFIAPKVQKTVTTIIEQKSSNYIDEKIKPLDQRVQTAATEASRIESEIKAKQEQLQGDQLALKAQLDIQQFATAAKSGDLEAYQKVKKQSATAGPEQTAAVSALREIEIYFDLDASQILTTHWVDKISLQDPGWSLEELVRDLHSQKDPALREAIVNTIGSFPEGDTLHQGIIGELFDQLKDEDNLRVIARIVHTVNRITKQSIRPLDRDVALKWWELHKREPQFQSPYESFLRAVSEEEMTNATMIKLLEETIEKEPNALFARCMKAATLIDVDDTHAAQAELDAVEQKRADFRWLYFVRAELNAKLNNKEKAVQLLNDAMKRSPTLEERAEQVPLLVPILHSKGIQRPSGKQP